MQAAQLAQKGSTLTAAGAAASATGGGTTATAAKGTALPARLARAGQAAVSQTTSKPSATDDEALKQAASQETSGAHLPAAPSSGTADQTRLSDASARQAGGQAAEADGVQVEVLTQGGRNRQKAAQVRNVPVQKTNVPQAAKPSSAQPASSAGQPGSAADPSTAQEATEGKGTGRQVRSAQQPNSAKDASVVAKADGATGGTTGGFSTAATSDSASAAALFNAPAAAMGHGASATQSNLAGVSLGVNNASAAGASAANPPAQDASQVPVPNLDDLASKTVRWQHLGVLDGQGSARIRLDPPELGSVQVQIQTVNNAVRIQMSVDSESVRTLLQSHSDKLAQSLQAHGMQASRIEVVVQTSQSRNDGDASEQKGSGQQSSQQSMGQQSQNSQQGQDGQQNPRDSAGFGEQVQQAWQELFA